MMKTSCPEFPAKQILRGLLSTHLPGESLASCSLRELVLRWVGDISARSVLLQGPIGVGKSSLARLLAFGKRVAPLIEEEARGQVEGLRFAAPSPTEIRGMTWYVELPLTGLVETLADAQLFGCTKGAFTSAIERAGVFEQASKGRGGGESERGSDMTGGIVFLDEIGDLSGALQAKLLPVLSGGKFYRVGGEGNPKYELEFQGIVISASWKTPIEHWVRPDLLSRVSACVIQVPSLKERREDIPELIFSVEARVRERLAETVKRMEIADPAVDRAFYRNLVQSRSALQPRDRNRLLDIDWSLFGELRGLTQTVERLLVGGLSFEDSLPRRITPDVNLAHNEEGVDSLVQWVLARAANGKGLAAHIGDFELSKRAEFRDYLQSNPALLRQVAEKLGIHESNFRDQLRQLTRIRSKS